MLGARPKTYRASFFMQILCLKVEPSRQKYAGLAGERMSTSALGDLVLPHLGRNGDVVVIVTLCENYPSLEQAVEFPKG